MFGSIGRLFPSLIYNPGMDSSCLVWTNVSVNRGIISGINIYNRHKGVVLLFSSVYIQKDYQVAWNNCTTTKGGPKVYIKNWQEMCSFHPTYNFHPLLSLGEWAGVSKASESSVWKWSYGSYEPHAKPLQIPIIANCHLDYCRLFVPAKYKILLPFLPFLLPI